MSYRLSEPATVGFTVKRASGGRLRAVGSFRHAGRRGLNRFRFSGRLHGRKLGPGRYHLVARTTDVAGNRSSPKRVRFEILR